MTNLKSFLKLIYFLAILPFLFLHSAFMNGVPRAVAELANTPRDLMKEWRKL